MAKKKTNIDYLKLYTNMMFDTIDKAVQSMKDFNANYLRDAVTVLNEDNFFRDKGINVNEYSPQELSDMVYDEIKDRIEFDDEDIGRLPIMCKDGIERNYDPESWAETQARTLSRDLQEEALHNEMAELGFDLVIVSTGGSGDDCSLWEGMILSIDGSSDFPSVDDARESGEIFHYNCFIDSQIPIYTSKGYKQIGKIKVGDLVLTHKGKLKKVTDIIKGNINKDDFVYKVIIDKTNYQSNELPFMTTGHPIFTENGWQKIEDIKENTKIMFLANRCFSCNNLIPAWKKYCSSSCKSKYHAKKNWACGKYSTMQIKRSKTLKKRYADNSIDRYAITKKANEKTRQLVKEGKHILQRSEIRDKGRSVLSQKKYNTKIENKMEWLLQQIGIKYERQYKFKREIKFENGNNRLYFIDFVLSDYKIAIECDGYYHTLETNSGCDVARQKEIENKGFTVLRFTEKQIIGSIKECGEEILRVVNNHSNSYEFIFIPIFKILKYKLKRGKKTYNISVDGDESYIAKYMVTHNCVHSTSPFLLTQLPDGKYKIFGRDDISDEALEQLDEAGIELQE